MKKYSLNQLVRLVLAMVALFWGVPQGAGQSKKVTRDQVYKEKFKKIPPSVLKEAAKKARLRGMKPGKAGPASQLPRPCQA